MSGHLKIPVPSPPHFSTLAGSTGFLLDVLVCGRRSSLRRKSCIGYPAFPMLLCPAPLLNGDNCSTERCQLFGLDSTVDTDFSFFESFQSYFKKYLRTQPQGFTTSSLMNSSKAYLRGKQKYISVGHVLFTAGMGYIRDRFLQRQLDRSASLGFIFSQI